MMFYFTYLILFSLFLMINLILHVLIILDCLISFMPSDFFIILYDCCFSNLSYSLFFSMYQGRNFTKDVNYFVTINDITYQTTKFGYYCSLDLLHFFWSNPRYHMPIEQTMLITSRANGSKPYGTVKPTYVKSFIKTPYKDWINAQK